MPGVTIVPNTGGGQPEHSSEDHTFTLQPLSDLAFCFIYKTVNLNQLAKIQQLRKAKTTTVQSNLSFECSSTIIMDYG